MGKTKVKKTGHTNEVVDIIWLTDDEIVLLADLVAVYGGTDNTDLVARLGSLVDK